MAQNRNDNFLPLLALDTIPLSTPSSVLISSQLGGRVFHLSAAEPIVQFAKGAWIWDKVNNVLYKVEDMNHDGLSGSIVGTFDFALAAATFAFIGYNDAKMVALSIIADADTIIGGSLPGGTPLLAGESYNIRRDDGTAGKISPVICTGGVRYLTSKT
jgi:hypothetical protein